MPIHHIDDYSYLEIKEKNFIDRFKPNIRTDTYTRAQKHIHTSTNLKTHPCIGSNAFSNTLNSVNDLEKLLGIYISVWFGFMAYQTL